LFGVSLVKADKEADAVKLLDQASVIAPEETSIYNLRCQCFVNLGNLGKARADLANLKALVADDPKAMKFASQLEQGIVAAEARMKEYGGPEAMALQQEAIKAFNADRHQEAIRLLRQAVALAPRAPKLRSDLATVLRNAAVAEFNAAGVSLRAIDKALPQLAEAQKLDPKDSHTLEAISTLAKLKARL
jgi:Flp pilus assembly protein TadD